MSIPGRVVVDASVAIRWLVPHEDTDSARAILANHATLLHAPDLIFAEVSNALWKYGHAGMQHGRLLRRLEDFSALRMMIAPCAELAEDALTIALRLDHPTYDCMYLALAVHENATLVTADRRFLEATRDTPYAQTVVWYEDLTHGTEKPPSGKDDDANI